MAEKKMYPRRNDYLKDFYKNLAGEYVYTGAYFEQQGTATEIKACSRKLSVEAIGIALALIFAGCESAAGMTGCWYVLMPYAVEAIAAFVTVWSLIRMLRAGFSLRAYVYERTVKKLPDQATLLMVFAGVSAAGAIAYLAIHGFEGRLAGALFYLLMKAAQMLLAYDVRRTVSAMRWESK